MTDRKKYKRRIKLIKPSLQLKLVGIFMGLSALGFVMQAMLVGLRLSEVAADLPRRSGAALIDLLPRLPLEVLLLSFGLVLPLIFAVGVVTTFRIAGPLYRFEQFLQAVIDGEQEEACRLRKGDELQGLCELINRATAPLREGARSITEEEDADGEELEAA